MTYSFNKICSNLIPAGKYKVQVTDVKFKTNTTGESTKDIAITYTIVDGPFAKKTVLDTIYEKAFSFRLKPFLMACKIDMAREFATAEEMYNYGLKEAKGKIVMIDLAVRAYNGNDYNNVTSVYPLPGSTTSSTDVLKNFNVEPSVRANVDINDICETNISTPKEDEDKEPSLEADTNDINIDDDTNPF